jgi:GNAT superfamily N-acetyltransferase
MDSRGLGIGTELMNHIIDYAKNKGVKNILLYTVKGSRQWKWYEKLGFVEYTRDTELVSGKYNWMVYTK